VRNLVEEDAKQQTCFSLQSPGLSVPVDHIVPQSTRGRLEGTAAAAT
jgi:hypothetical protein